MSPRARVFLVVALVAVVAAAATVAGALVQARDVGGEVHGQTVETQGEGPQPPALELAVLGREDREARRLREAERLYEEGDREEARRRFEALLERNPDSIEAAVGAAITGWPDPTVDPLEDLVEEHPESGVARLNLGLALLAEGDVEGARDEWREVKRRDPDSPAALRADDLLNPGSPPGRPVFVADIRLPQAFVAAVARGDDAVHRSAERLAERGDATGYLRLGAAFQRLGRAVSAQRAFDRAVAAAPNDLRARAAAAVSRFDKEDPSHAFSRLGPLVSRHPDAPVLRYHLGLMLLWLPDAEGAREQLRRARAADPRGFYGREASRILMRLDGAE